MRKFLENIYNKVLKSGAMFATWYGISNPWGSDSFTTIDGTASRIAEVIKFAIAASGLAAVAAIVYGAYLIIISAGDSDKYEQGMNTIQAAIVGMVIVFLSYAIITFLIDRGIIA